MPWLSAAARELQLEFGDSSQVSLGSTQQSVPYDAIEKLIGDTRGLPEPGATRALLVGLPLLAWLDALRRRSSAHR